MEEGRKFVEVLALPRDAEMGARGNMGCEYLSLLPETLPLIAIHVKAAPPRGPSWACLRAWLTLRGETVAC